MASSGSLSSLGKREQGGDEWNVVIKVKSGDTLRRFSARVHYLAYVGQPLLFIEYDINQLRAKISSLFNFSNEAALVLSYTDEDGDVVCLDSDDELRDAVISQRLNPLRINVQLKPHSTDDSNSSSKSVKNTDKQSDTVNPAHNTPPKLATELNSVVIKSLKPFPEPIRGVLSNLSHDMIQTASSAPVFSELLSFLSKVQLTNNVSQSSHEPVSKSMGASIDVPFASAYTDEPKDPNPVPDYTQNTSSEEKLVKPLHTSTSKKQEDESKVHLDAKSVQNAESFPNFFGSQSFVAGNSLVAPTVTSGCPIPHPYRRSHSLHHPVALTFHRGVICDGCGMHPIVGPRYKSTVRENFDLCSTCFRDMGMEPEYRRIDSAYRFPKLNHHKLHHKCRSLSTIISHGRTKAPTAKLESSFVIDVTVWDGTVVQPSSRFTKIWRMRNTGTVAWPAGTHLVWVRGHRLGVHAVAKLEIPERGFPVDFELDIAIDCVAPSACGKYTSYWQMASPSGQNFGEEVWIIIQVWDPQSDFASITPPTLNLNFPPESNQQSDPASIDVNSVNLGFIPVDPNADKLLDELLNPAASDMLKSVSENAASSPPSSNDSLTLPIIDIPPASCLALNPVIGIPKSAPANTTTTTTTGLQTPFTEILPPSPPVPNLTIDNPPASAVSYPLVDVTDISSPLVINYTAPDFGEESLVELTLLKELEEMGFTQTDLNKDILRQNRYDLEQSVEELCEFAEWDPLLKELQEMGFEDRELNMKLLSKNGGSIKRVVMELVTGERGG